MPCVLRRVALPQALLRPDQVDKLDQVHRGQAGQRQERLSRGHGVQKGGKGGGGRGTDRAEEAGARLGIGQAGPNDMQLSGTAHQSKQLLFLVHPVI